MDIAIVCIDTRGGVQPYLALAIGLHNAGHRVRFLAPTDYEGVAASRGLAFYGIRGDLQRAVRTHTGPSNGIDKGFLRGHLLMIRTVASMISQWMADVYEACRGADLILGGFGGMLAGEAVAERLEVPFVQAHVQPLTPTRDFRGLIRLPGMPNRWSHRLGRQAFWQPLRPAVNHARRTVLGLGDAEFFGTAGCVSREGCPILYGYSAALLPRPTDWPTAAHVTGYWFLNEQKDWRPPPDLVRFLEQGPKPVLIGFGSMASSDAAATDALLESAVRLSGQRAVLVSGWSRTSRAADDARLFRTDAVPYSWLMTKVSMAVHHGGAGTTGAALAAGIPSAVIPHTADQPFWGHVIASRGLGPNPIPRNRLTAERLAAAIRETVGNNSYGDNAREIAARMQQEDGVSTAANIISTLTSRHNRWPGQG